MVILAAEVSSPASYTLGLIFGASFGLRAANGKASLQAAKEWANPEQDR